MDNNLKEVQQMFVELNKQLADVVELIRQANKTSEEALESVRELVDAVARPRANAIPENGRFTCRVRPFP